MKFAIFNYPEEFRTLEDHTQHARQFVRVGRQYSKKDADRGPDLERLFHITAGDGWKGAAYESELLDPANPKRRLKL